MRGFLDCFPCFLRQALDTARLSTPDEGLRALSIYQVLGVLRRIDYRLPPPLIAFFVYGAIKEVTHCTDPYERLKAKSNEAALGFYDWATRLVAESPDPLQTAKRLACAGNVVDFGVGSGFDLGAALSEVRDRGFAIDDSARLRERLGSARRLIYIGDNAGEVVFDRVLLETIKGMWPGIEIVFVVRGGPIINDVTRRDARAVGMDRIARVISTGFAAPGVPLDLCSDEFLAELRQADVVIAKGQGNYESLSGETPKRVFFILRVKCAVVARDLGVPVGSFVLKEGGGEPWASSRRSRQA